MRGRRMPPGPRRVLAAGAVAVAVVLASGTAPSDGGHHPTDDGDDAHTIATDVVGAHVDEHDDDDDHDRHDASPGDRHDRTFATRGTPGRAARHCRAHGTGVVDAARRRSRSSRRPGRLLPGRPRRSSPRSPPSPARRPTPSRHRRPLGRAPPIRTRARRG